MQTPTQFSSSQFTTTTEKTYKQLTLHFLPPPFSPVLVSLLQNPYTFGGRCWPSKRMAPVNTSESNQSNYTEAERVLQIDARHPCIHPSG
jgi:hypothetical protein